MIPNWLNRISAREGAGYIFIFVASSLLAWYIRTPEGKKWVDENTTLSVIIGSVIILLGLKVILRPRQFGKAVAAFALAGSPMVARKLEK